jgi:hypothetical protein
MIKCYLLDGKSSRTGEIYEDFKTIEAVLMQNQSLLWEIPAEALVLLLDAWGRAISKDKSILGTEGAAYLSFYLKRNNVENLISSSVGNLKYLDEFVESQSQPGKYLKAQGRGIVCHWIAGNVKTLAIYSLINSLLGRNSNIMKLPKESLDEVLDILSLFAGLSVEYRGRSYCSDDILKNIAMVHFDSQDEYLNSCMSKVADARVIWGGQTSVNAINLLPKKTTCRDVVFGPKYSFAVMDSRLVSEAFASPEMIGRYMSAFAMDIAQFGQNACSSPHVLFIEGTAAQAEAVAESLGRALEKMAKRNPNNLGEAKASRIINERARYALSLERDVKASRDLSWTILLGSGPTLEEPLGGRCIYIKNIDDIFMLEDQVTKMVQTIGFEGMDREKAVRFADRVSRRGADRIVRFGGMNAYEVPWDGTFLLNEIVRWCSLDIEN